MARVAVTRELARAVALDRDLLAHRRRLVVSLLALVQNRLAPSAPHLHHLRVPHHVTQLVFLWSLVNLIWHTRQVDEYSSVLAEDKSFEEQFPLLVAPIHELVIHLMEQYHI